MRRYVSRLFHRDVVLQVVAFGVLANGLIIVATTLVEELFLRGSGRINALLTSLPLLSGLTLIYLATLLMRRKRTAWLVVLPVYAFIFALNIWQLVFIAAHHHVGWLHILRNVALPGVIVYGLVRYREDFTVRSDVQSFRLALRTSVLILLVTLAYGIGGFLLMDRHDFHQEITPVEAVHRTVDQFDLTTDHSLEPATRRARLFLDSLSVLSTGALAYIFISLFQPIRGRFADQTTNRELMQALLERYTASSEDFFKLWPHDKVYFLSRDHEAALAYHVRSGIALVVGDPAGKHSSFALLLQDFTAFCRLNDWTAAFIHTDPNYNDLYEKHDFALQKIGEEAIVDISHFNQHVKPTKYFRQIQNKFAKQGYRVELLKPPHNAAVIQRLREVNDDWLKLPGRSERSFMMGYFSVDYMQLCDIMVARDAAGTIQAFINNIASFDSEEANYDLLRQTQHSLTNTNDFLLMNFIEYVGQQGFKRLNLGLCPLAGLGNDDEEHTVIDSTLSFVYAAGDRFYSFSGLRKFKAKYEPTWSSRYVAYRGGIRGFTRTLNALNRVMGKVKRT